MRRVPPRHERPRLRRSSDLVGVVEEDSWQSSLQQASNSVTFYCIHSASFCPFGIQVITNGKLTLSVVLHC
jgi:hypothetical protein